MDKTFDVVVWGATGFTGRLVAEYLAGRYGLDGEVKWTIGGRNGQKLESLRQALQAGVGQLPPQVADSHDLEALRTIVRQTRVMCTTVGPYARYGSELVQACAEEGVDYCDLTGEVHWMHEMIMRHDATAAASGARIVHTCGFDSIPSDLGVFYVQRAMAEAHGVYATEVKYRALDFKGGFSGGTVASMLDMLERAEQDPSVEQLISDPYALDPHDGVRGLDGPDSNSAFYDADFKAWAAPFVMAGINTRVVRRSHALMGYPYGDDFRYNEATLIRAGVVGATIAASVSVGTAGMLAAMAFAPTRNLLARWLPSPGEGPSQTAREAGFFKIALLGKHPETEAKDVLIYVRGDRDPGYGSTAKMLAESAACLARDGINVGGGIATPASTMGAALVDRLHQNAGVTFELGPTSRTEPADAPDAR